MPTYDAALLYAARDKTTVDPIASQLSELGLRLWRPDNYWPSFEQFSLASLVEVFSSSSHVVAMLSTSTGQSAWVRQEIALARDMRKHVIPCVIGDSPSPPPEEVLESFPEIPIQRVIDLRPAYWRFDWTDRHTATIRELADALRSEPKAAAPHGSFPQSTGVQLWRLFGLPSLAALALYQLNRTDWPIPIPRVHPFETIAAMTPTQIVLAGMSFCAAAGVLFVCRQVLETIAALRIAKALRSHDYVLRRHR